MIERGEKPCARRWTMAFRLKLDEPVVKGFRRIGVEQIERALKQLAGTEHAVGVHESRKCMKRIRALLRLGRAGLGETVFRTENAYFRGIAASLSPARDDQVLIETVVGLEAETRDETRASLARLKTALLSAQNQDLRTNGSNAIDDARADLERALRRFRRLRLEPNTFSILIEGLTRCYRSGRKGLETAYGGGDDEAFHDWRKSVQTHWRQMALLSRAWPALFEVRVEAARELSQLLGEDHDLAILKARLAGFPAVVLDAGETADIMGLLVGRQRALRAAARPRGQLLFAEPAKAHGQRVAAMWEAAVTKGRADRELAETAAPPPSKAEEATART
jgi:CHAD domain-containing protein